MLALFTLPLLAQVIEEDTTQNRPFFEAKKFNSKAFVGFEAQVTQILKTKVGMNAGLNINWVINHKYVVSAKYHTLTTGNEITNTIAPGYTKPIKLSHHFAGLAFSYILFADKKFSFQPELAAGWASMKYEYPAKTFMRHDYGAIIPAVYGVYNATKYFRFGVGLNYRAVIGTKYNGITPADLSGLAGVVFLRVGTF